MFCFFLHICLKILARLCKRFRLFSNYFFYFEFCCCRIQGPSEGGDGPDSHDSYDGGTSKPMNSPNNDNAMTAPNFRGPDSASVVVEREDMTSWGALDRHDPHYGHIDHDGGGSDGGGDDLYGPDDHDGGGGGGSFGGGDRDASDDDRF